MEPNELKQEPFKAEIELEDFRKLDFRICQVVACEEVVKSRNFLKLTVNDGQGERTIMSTIRSYYKPEELVGKKIVVLVNLKPHKFCGVVSEGMLIAVDMPEQDDCKVLFAHDGCPVGQSVS
ncbi:methionine--tRNA ligase subunit beta [Oscillibacter sp. MSJ-2]|uniref:Methionine--tRNA ligase subunit beta n=1 Tax=Dysosmobacter acutus TaxID=2841504 RepID=A0ABS6F9A6_9FIRM|nr:methionine--tRNA ligase subunit beta [Dysosmobacter acutus]MBU5626871.1 methionine--tRNA ligase subunit beta [Dysosmobacter acutus]